MLSPVHAAVHNAKLARPEHLVWEDLISLADLSLAPLLLLLLLRHLDTDRLGLLDWRRTRLLLADGRLGACLHHRGHGGSDGGLELCHGQFIRDSSGSILGLERL